MEKIFLTFQKKKRERKYVGTYALKMSLSNFGRVVTFCVRLWMFLSNSPCVYLEIHRNSDKIFIRKSKSQNSYETHSHWYQNFCSWDFDFQMNILNILTRIIGIRIKMDTHRKLTANLPKTAFFVLKRTQRDATRIWLWVLTLYFWCVTL